ncbi:MAG: hypothetical protein R8P61_20850 [Bacteroidia bacterium]|nr:hypothetical protein [Bacteroidia bacterium]
MKKLVFFTVLLSILAFACTDNPLFKVSIDIPYNTTYTVKASDQVEGQLILESDEGSYSSFLAKVQEEMDNNGIEANFEADITHLEITIPEEVELDWSVLGNVNIDFSVNGESSTLLDEVSFPSENSKIMKVGLPASGISINDFLSYESASIKIVADLEESLADDITLTISAEVKVSSLDKE